PAKRGTVVSLAGVPVFWTVFPSSSPASFTARTAKAYVVPAVSPPTTALSAPTPLCTTGVMNLSADAEGPSYTRYRRTAVGLPAWVAAFHTTRTDESETGATAVIPANVGDATSGAPPSGAAAAASLPTLPPSPFGTAAPSVDASAAMATQSLPFCTVPLPHARPDDDEDEQSTRATRPPTRQVLASAASKVRLAARVCLERAVFRTIPP